MENDTHGSRLGQTRGYRSKLCSAYSRPIQTWRRKSVMWSVGFTCPVPSPTSSGISSSTGWGAWTHDCLVGVREVRQPPLVAVTVSHWNVTYSAEKDNGSRDAGMGGGLNSGRQGKLCLGWSTLLDTRGVDHRLPSLEKGKTTTAQSRKVTEQALNGKMGEDDSQKGQKEKEGLKRGSGSTHAIFWGQ